MDGIFIIQLLYRFVELRGRNFFVVEMIQFAPVYFAKPDIRKDTAIIVLMVIFSAGNRAFEQRIHFSGQKHSQNRSGKIDPEGAPKMGKTALPRVRAGFMLMPEIGGDSFGFRLHEGGAEKRTSPYGNLGFMNCEQIWSFRLLRSAAGRSARFQSRGFVVKNAQLSRLAGGQSNLFQTLSKILSFRVLGKKVRLSFSMSGPLLRTQRMNKTTVKQHLK